MSIRRLLRPTNRRARVVVGLLLAGLFLVLCTQTQAVRTSSLIRAIDGRAFGANDPEVLRKVEQLARKDHIALLQFCLDRCEERFGDYTCTFIKQERIAGKLGPEQWMDVRVMESPFSVAMTWTRNAPMADRVLYVEGRYGGRFLARPTNALLRRLVRGGTVARDPNDPMAMENTLRPVNLFGFRHALRSLLDVYRQAAEAGDLTASFGGYKNVGGRDTIVLVRHLPARHDYPAWKTVVYIDLEYLVPVCLEGYDWDRQLSCRYVYKDVKFNVGLTGEDFLPKVYDLTAPN